MCDVNEEFLKETIDKEKEYEIKKYEIVFKRPSFGETVELYDSIFSASGNSIDFNPLQARYKKIILLIKEWNLEDAEGNKIDINDKNIRSLHPLIGAVIGVQVDLETGGSLT